MPRSPMSPPGSSHSSSKQTDATRRKKKSWSLEAKKKKDQPKSRQQIKAMLLAKDKKTKEEEDVDAPPNSDAKDDSLRIVEQHKFVEKEEYAMKQPQIGLKRKVKKKGNRRVESVRVLRKNRSRSDTPKMHSRESSGSSTPVDTTLFKERASANNSNANSPDNSDRQREREMRRRALDIELRRRALEERTQERTQDRTNDNSAPQDSEGDSTPLPLAREPEPEIEHRRTTVVQRSTVEKSASRVVKTKQSSMLPVQQQKAIDTDATTRPSQPRTARSTMGMPSSSSSSAMAKPTGEASTQLALEPEPDLDRVRRQKEAAFMKRFLTALKLLPNTAPPRPITPQPRSDDSPSESSKRRPGNYKHNMHQMRKHPK